MKDHFHELLIETSRACDHSLSPNHRVRHRDLEEAPFHERMTYHNGSGRCQRDNLNPLRQYIKSNVGRPWNKVYSEICSRNDARNLSQYHLRSHVEDVIERNVLMIDGKPYRREGSWGRLHPLNSGTTDRCYVNPVTGLVCAVPAARRPGSLRDQPQAEVRIELGKGWAYQKLEGVWYRTHTEIRWSRTRQGCDVVTTVRRSVVGARELARAGLA